MGFIVWGFFVEYCVIDYVDVNLVCLFDSMDFVIVVGFGCCFVMLFCVVVD